MSLWPRRAMIGVGVLAALGGTLLRVTNPFGRHYRTTPYDDLIGHLTDREAGARVGRAVIAGEPNFDMRATVGTLRAALGTASLGANAGADIVAGRMIEAGGWVLPQTLALLCAVAAKFTPAQPG
jgi:hypothetical protein